MARQPALISLHNGLRYELPGAFTILAFFEQVVLQHTVMCPLLLLLVVDVVYMV